MSFVKANSHSHEQIASVVEGGPVEMKLGGGGGGGGDIDTQVAIILVRKD